MSKSIEKQLDTRDLEDFKRSLSRLKGQGNLDEEYDICTSIGDLYVKTGKLHKSLEYFFSALSIAKAMKNSDLKCDAFHSIAGILSDSSICLWDKALMYVNFQLSECDRTSKSTGGKSLSIDSAQERFLDAANVKANRQAAYFQQGLIYMQRDDNLAGIFSKIYLQEAKRAFSSALSELECFEETTEVLRMKANTFLNLALTYERLEDTSNSELYFSNSFSVANAIQDDEALARFYTNRGMKLLEERNFVATEKVCQIRPHLVIFRSF
ncbi:hypothetical protein DI09_5p420 [Mitosporidium daphniae]|uniref:Uncharacterized protein n=1 Tax=Mitosporidium daphniae TaxID=1485682 RepID=A0A098VP02_9MICR|nr:uncharacterized protein DI09_5p420 [Mitosporidium daphniae]KGG50695.1 hypothetical protein DI09_5p420 [Mitosporidium daphniae]|eukprot:XP_013237122.1 uncharacterized protein DI09_5p420 [Mitosporidium daphniae]